MADYILEAENLSYIYPDGTQALKGLYLRIPRSQKTAVLGSNGAGKSTLFLHFNGILKPKSGTVKFNGNNVSYDRRSLLELRKNVGIVFQDPDSQLFSASVYQEISFGPLNLGLTEKTVRDRVERAMTATGINELKDKPTHMLSYGQKKRVTIADILAMEPQVLICDEPTAWLDPKHAKQTLQLFDKIIQNGTTVVLSTHDVDLAYSWADYVFIMSDGRVIGEGVPDKVFSDDALLRNADLDRPWLVDVHDLLIKKGCIPPKATLPRNKEELFEKILYHGICTGEQ
ncbi:energy-coupling factor ABC transporter ATP-binding protein [Desulfotruncus alcoholivorax]|uniref:energy-coupling factor ABC transporter ATP-binding protein n=1 Tax=Desulfotruncus alcoholivorax TaxID=265477 RepID=UPI0004075E53|nr:ATP-binding cassette domain-containing protein [Desulfotruncus alcoholivorax]